MLYLKTPTPGNCHAEYIADELNRAHGPDTAYHLSHALHSLQEHARVRRTALTEGEAASMIAALDKTTPDAMALFPVCKEGAFAFDAMGKSKALVRHWADATGGLDRGAHHNALSCVIWLRNHCHNLSLLDEIEAYHTARSQEARRVQHEISTADVTPCAFLTRACVNRCAGGWSELRRG